jgi:hypothetical protein
MDLSGTISSFIKNFNATKHEDDLPKAEATIVDQHYVDGYLECVNYVEKVLELISDVIEIHSRGGFEIRGNSNDVVKQIPEELITGEKYIMLLY